MITSITGRMYADCIKSGAASLKKHKTTVNDLNVFPIPDGDTGDNMYMTINSGAHSVSDETTGIGRVASDIANGMLLGARGNSGVILSKIFYGISLGLKDLESATVNDIASAMEMGVTEAYNAVSIPVEGTILTVIKDAVSLANSLLNESTTHESYFNTLTEEMKSSLDRTPELLEVLKTAGVVDSGGAGIVYIAEGIKNALNGMPEDDEEKPDKENRTADISVFTSDMTLEYGYCTEFLLRLQSAKVDVDNFDVNIIRDYLNAAGESVVCFKNDSIVKVHVHTMNPGDILNECRKYGEFLSVKIENMMLQHNNSEIKNEYTSKKTMPHKKYGTVAVAFGSGIKNTFAELGVDEIIDGGQSMNPSAEDFVKAFGKINADTIFVFPNNSNIVMTAKQAAEIYDKADIRVIKTKTIGEGYAALSMADFNADSADDITAEAEEIISSVVTGMVSTAIRDTELNGISIEKGNYIGFTEDAVYSADKTMDGACVSLAEKLDAGKYDVMLFIYGQNALPEATESALKTLNNRYKKTEIIPIDGGQPIYNYIMILE